MSIRKRLASFILLMTSLLVALGALLLVAGPITVGAFRHSMQAMNSLDAIRSLRTNVTRQRTSLNRYLLLDERQEWISYVEASQAAEKSLQAIQTRAGTTVPDYPALAKHYQNAVAAAAEVANLYKKGNKAKAYEDATFIFDKLLLEVTQLENRKATEAQVMFDRVRRLSQSIEAAVALVLGCAFIFGVFLFRSLYRAVMKPLEALKKGADEFGRGHWDHRIDLPSTNEFGALAVSFNNMAENVKQLQLQAVHMDRMSAVGQLAGGVAHEINNPLTAVLGQAQILLARIPASDPICGQISKIEQAALRCKKIVRGLLDFSRPSQAAFEQIDLQSIMNATVELCEADLKKARVTVEKKLPKSVPLVEGNPSELQQVLLNLFNNAIQAMPRGGTLTLETRLRDDDLTITDSRKGMPARKITGPWVEILVRDSGVGIPKDHLQRVFEPFFTTKEIGKGTGLGLAVSLGIMQKHGGDLRVDSPGLNKGATFTLILPLRRTQRSGAERTAA